jgi:hypothetical protein
MFGPTIPSEPARILCGGNLILRHLRQLTLSIVMVQIVDRHGAARHDPSSPAWKVLLVEFMGSPT